MMEINEMIKALQRAVHILRREHCIGTAEDLQRVIEHLQDSAEG